MALTHYQSKNDIRLQFTQAMSKMYQREVPLYKTLKSIASNVNANTLKTGHEITRSESQLLSLEHHGAIRVGTADELSTLRRLFAVMGMHAVDYYDLNIAGIPVHSTAFRPTHSEDINKSPFRVFCSLLRLELIENSQIRTKAAKILKQRQIFSADLLNLIELSEIQNGLTLDEAQQFTEKSLEVFRWHHQSTVDLKTYEIFKKEHGLVADIVSFKGPHINHLTPKVLDIDACQKQFIQQGIKAKAFVEGPPKRNCPILLRQTSFIAKAEHIRFTDNKEGTHTARFGEVEQRGIALTLAGRKLYDKLLEVAKSGDSKKAYEKRLIDAFTEFPDSYKAMRQQGLAYFKYSTALTKKELIGVDNSMYVTKMNVIDHLIEQGVINVKPINYEDFLPVSAAGIFTSNLATSSKKLNQSSAKTISLEQSSKALFEKALGCKTMNSFDLYEEIQNASLSETLVTLGISV